MSNSYKVVIQRRGKRHEHGPMTEAEAINKATASIRGASAVVILREGGQPDFHPHPSNAGQYFLYRIVR